VPLVEFVAELFDVDFSGHVTLEEYIMTVTERTLSALYIPPHRHPWARHRRGTCRKLASAASPDSMHS
jgi:hypothetical protein